MWPRKQNRLKQDQEGTVAPSYMSVGENLRMVALQYALSIGGPNLVLRTATEYLNFLNGTTTQVIKEESNNE